MRTPGYYTLKHDVVNPKPDRRKKHDVFAQPVIKAGTKIVVRGGENASSQYRVRGFYGYFDMLFAWENGGLFVALEAAEMDPREPTMKERLEEYNLENRAVEFLEFLKVTDEQLEAFATHVNALEA